MILHEHETFSDIQHNIEFASDILRKTQKPVLFMFHGVGCNRIKAIQTYKQLRKHFLVISVDHRGKFIDYIFQNSPSAKNQCCILKKKCFENMI